MKPPSWLRRLVIGGYTPIRRPVNPIAESLAHMAGEAERELPAVKADRSKQFYWRMRKELAEANRRGDVRRVKQLTAWLAREQT